MNLQDIVSEDDAFQLETKQYVYYYALQYRLNSGQDVYYKIRQKDNKIFSSSAQEIGDIILNHPDKIISKCPCVVVKDGKAQPLVH